MHRSYTRRFAGTGVAICLLVALAPRVHAGISIQANYTDAAGVGFNDATDGALRQSAFEYALDIWGNALGPSYLGETITIDAKFDSLSAGTLANAAATSNWNLNTSTALVYASALANHIVGYDLDASESEGYATFNGNENWYYGTDNAAPGGEYDFVAIALREIGHALGFAGSLYYNASESEGYATFNGNENWYYGTDNAAPGGEYDFVAIALREIGHALGFAGSLYYNASDTGDPDNGQYDADVISRLTNGNDDSGAERYNQYDLYVGRLNGDGSYTQLVDLTAAERITAATSGNLYWGGADAFAANGGAYPKLYAPSPWQQGSSYSHLDETTFALELMSPTYTAGTPHALSDLTIAMMVDMGWDSNVPEPGTLAVWSVLAVSVSFSRRRRRGSVRTHGEAS